ncbi:MAG: glycosyltransferase [Alphaproteobacteria bacterium]|uniref:Exostosin GT47 domain-containing protein n=1 Tax=viral metagenome TaxID=1070528 RepID=A0A6C0HQQ3_9ZZZZ|nr:glycosyltransferase [Alphaproteobacteria bacterium]
MANLVNDELFYVKNGVTYPPFKNGYYLEEHFLNYTQEKDLKYDKNGRLYIPALWTNFQIEGWFQDKKNYMQDRLNNFVDNNPCENGYFTVVQYDDGPLLNLPNNTIVYGACSGNIPIPLIYEDKNNTLLNTPKKSYNEKNVLCSFVGTITHNVRQTIVEQLSSNQNFTMNVKNGWSTDIPKNNQDSFIELTVNSKFSLAPRGYGRSSFRFFEIYKLGSIPVYIWDDIEWLPYKELIDYSKICISIHVSKINELETMLLNVDEEKYNNMWLEYEKIKHMFELDYMSQYIAEEHKWKSIKLSLCIPTLNRFDGFLNEYIEKYLQFLNDGVIDEIVISDENGNDYYKILEKYGNNNPNLRVYKNENVLGVFLNKLKVCSYSSKNFIALIDSDNFCNIDYFIKMKKYILDNNLHLSEKPLLLSPSFAKPNFNFKHFENAVITRNTIENYENENVFSTLMNLGNYILTKNITDNITYDVNLLKNISACDVQYFNLLAFRQFSNLEFHVIKDAEYQHVVHGDSEYLKTIGQCCNTCEEHVYSQTATIKYLK